MGFMEPIEPQEIEPLHIQPLPPIPPYYTNHPTNTQKLIVTGRKTENVSIFVAKIVPGAQF